MKNCWIDPDGTVEIYGRASNMCVCYGYDASKEQNFAATWYGGWRHDNSEINNIVFDESGNAIQFSVTTTGGGKDIRYLRFTLGGDASAAIITINETIPD